MDPLYFTRNQSLYLSAKFALSCQKSPSNVEFNEKMAIAYLPPLNNSLLVCKAILPLFKSFFFFIVHFYHYSNTI